MRYGRIIFDGQKPDMADQSAMEAIYAAAPCRPQWRADEKQAASMTAPRDHLGQAALYCQSRAAVGPCILGSRLFWRSGYHAIGTGPRREGIGRCGQDFRWGVFRPALNAGGSAD